jgi:hypothetical protein
MTERNAFLTAKPAMGSRIYRLLDASGRLMAMDFEIDRGSVIIKARFDGGIKQWVVRDKQDKGFICIVTGCSELPPEWTYLEVAKENRGLGQFESEIRSAMVRPVCGSLVELYAAWNRVPV